jgi:putative ABC transport system substrate-binding protein
MTVTIERRKLLAALGGAAAAWPLAPRAQQPAGRLPRIGILYFGWNENIAAFLQGLRDGGYIDGQSAIIEARYYGTLIDRLPELAKDLVALNCDVIYAAAPYAIQAAMKATSTIPIVGGDLESDPVASGWARTLARPGGNLTGTFLDLPELGGKQIELLKDAVPGLSRVAVLWDSRSAACSFVPRRQRRAQRGSHCNRCRSNALRTSIRPSTALRASGSME